MSKVEGGSRHKQCRACSWSLTSPIVMFLLGMLVLIVVIVLFRGIKQVNREDFSSSFIEKDYNQLQNYDSNSFFFQVSPKRQEALDNQVKMCTSSSSSSFEDPVQMMAQCKNKYNCHSYLQRGGYDACSNCDKKECSPSLAGI